MLSMRGVRSLPLQPARTNEPELLDGAIGDPSLLAENFRDIRRVNRWLGGTALSARGLAVLLNGVQVGESIAVLDIATGCADIPVALEAWLHGLGLQPRIVATDISPSVLALAPHGETSGIETALADARCLPFADDSFDVVMCSLALHHMGRPEAVAMLREMGRVAVRGVVVNDLVRSWYGYGAAWAISRLLTGNPLTRHDAPLSVRRAYTRTEMAELAAEAGLRPVALMGALGYRVAMVAGKPA